MLFGCASQNPGGSARAKWGEYGGRIEMLRAAYTPPQAPNESNHYIDLIEGSSVRNYARTQGLVANNTLFVLSHGKAVTTHVGRRYAFLPGARGRPPNEHGPAFSPLDLARLVGPDHLGRIHNLVLAGCNNENSFYPAEFLACFPAVTNIIHATRATDAYESTFRHVLAHHSSEIRELYLRPDANGMVRFGDSPMTTASEKLVPYMARLYTPGKRRLYRVQVAGRELLDPVRFEALAPK